MHNPETSSGTGLWAIGAALGIEPLKKAGFFSALPLFFEPQEGTKGVASPVLLTTKGTRGHKDKGYAVFLGYG
jgi:hypothetical protein